MIYSDVLFYEKVVSEVLQIQEDIVLVIDSTYHSHLDKHKPQKTRMELVIAKNQVSNEHYRMLTPLTDLEIKMIGQRVSPDRATHEFAGIAYFSEQGADILKKVYHEAKQKYAGKQFHEAATFEKASFADIIQEIIYMGFPIKVYEVNQGWQEIHNTHDYKHALESLQC